MAAPERFAEMTDFPLAPRAPSIHGTSATSVDVGVRSEIGAITDIGSLPRMSVIGSNSPCTHLESDGDRPLTALADKSFLTTRTMAAIGRGP